MRIVRDIAMTIQISDKFSFKGEEYAICGVRGGELFSPKEHDLDTHSTSSGCWRGYQAFYNIIDDHLVIDNLFINLEEEKKINDKQPKILGKPDFNKEPSIESNWNFFKFYYTELLLKLNFTGAVLIAKDFVEAMGAHMGFQKPMAYETVIELKIKNGKLIEEIDKSKIMARRREEMYGKGSTPKSESDEDLEEWVSDSFSLNYEENVDETKKE